MRSLIAWDKGNPKRLVQLSSSTNDEQIGAILDPSSLALYGLVLAPSDRSAIWLGKTAAVFVFLGD